ncbi:Ig-like domain-containing protein [Intestinibacter sp.]|uniref:Ig-like domain-containing protein n=1 Tax=Intestinibacter sp. TaxID=1965304 RepID=UPI003F18B024
MKKTQSKLITLIMSILLIILISPVNVFAGNGDGSGGGDGQGKNKPLELLNQSIQDDDTDISLEPYIVLDFNKNVVNLLVKEDNEKCFKLTDSDGKSVKINILMADDQVDLDRRRQIIVEPAKALKEDSKYTLEISDDLVAKSGSKLESDIEIEFTTGTSSSTKSSKDEYDPDAVVEDEDKDNKTEDSDNQNNDEKTDNSNENNDSENKTNENDQQVNPTSNNTTIYIAIAVVAVLIIGFGVYYKKSKTK